MSKKYRPYLSLVMMERIMELCTNSVPNHLPLSSLDQEIYNSIHLMVLKGRTGITQPSFTPIVDKLGIPEPEWKEVSKEDAIEEMRYTSGQMKPEEALAYEQKLMAKITGTIS